MSRRPFLKVALVLLGCAAVVVAAQSGGETKPTADAPPALVSAVAPFFPPIAKAARARGRAVVEVKVDESGAVTSAEYVSGHPLLKKACLDAAPRWRFAAAGDAKGARTAQLTFLFDERDDKPEPYPAVQQDLVTFMPPYTVEVRAGITVIH